MVRRKDMNPPPPPPPVYSGLRGGHTLDWTLASYSSFFLFFTPFHVTHKGPPSVRPSVRCIHMCVCSTTDMEREEGKIFLLVNLLRYTFILHQCRTSDWELLADGDENKRRGYIQINPYPPSSSSSSSFLAIIDQRSIRWRFCQLEETSCNELASISCPRPPLRKKYPCIYKRCCCCCCRPNGQKDFAFFGHCCPFDER